MGSRSNTLRTRYVAALAAIAFLSILGQFVVQWMLTIQADDSAVINLAGRQRMLSQRIVKTALLLERAAEPDAYLEQLAELASEWSAVHRGLREGDELRGLSGLLKRILFFIEDGIESACLDNLSQAPKDFRVLFSFDVVQHWNEHKHNMQ